MQIELGLAISIGVAICSGLIGYFVALGKVNKRIDELYQRIKPLEEVNEILEKNRKKILAKNLKKLMSETLTTKENKGGKE